MSARALRLELLEDRATPAAAFSVPWLSPDVTVSVMADGTKIDGVSSNLSAALAGDGLSSAAWQAEIGRAVQAWVAVTGVNVGMVAESGSVAAGAAGHVQGDARFGDIRIGGRPLAGNVLAITTPPGEGSETRAGDIVVNTSFDFGVQPTNGRQDLFTVFAQEIGHALGVGNSADPASVMHPQYTGVKPGLTAGDAAAAQSLYGGPRPADPAEGAGNGTTATATPLPVATGTDNQYIRGDLTTPGDIDVYSFVTPRSSGDDDDDDDNGISVKLRTAGLSLAAARLEVVSASGRVLAASSSGVAPGADVSLAPNLSANTKYYVRVSAPNGTYQVGGYEVRVVADRADADRGRKPPHTFPSDGGSNDTPATAAAPAPLTGTTARRTYRVTGKAESASDVDVIRVTAPPLAADATTTLVVSVEGFSSGAPTGTPPVVRATAADGTAATLTPVPGVGPRRTFQLAGVTGGSTYLLTVGKFGQATATDYRLTAVFQDRPPVAGLAATAELTAATGTAFRTLTVARTQVVSLTADAALTAGTASGSVTLAVFNAAGQTVASVPVVAGRPTTVAILLAPGEYTIRVRATGLSAGTAYGFHLGVGTLTDPVGLDAPVDPTDVPTDGTPPALADLELTQQDLAYYAWLG